MCIAHCGFWYSIHSKQAIVFITDLYMLYNSSERIFQLPDLFNFVICKTSHWTFGYYSYYVLDNFSCNSSEIGI